MFNTLFHISFEMNPSSVDFELSFTKRCKEPINAKVCALIYFLTYKMVKFCLIYSLLDACV